MREVRYESDERNSSGNRNWIFRMFVDQEVVDFVTTGGLSNREFFAGPDFPITVHSSASRDRGDIRPRGINLLWTSTAPAGYEPGGKIFIPIFRQFTYRDLHVGGLGTFRGQSVMIVAKVPEVFRS